MLIDTNNYIHRINGVPLYYNGLNSAFLHHSLGGHFDYHHPAATPDTTPPYTNNYEYLMPKTVAITEHLHNFAPITPPLSPSSDKQPPSVAETSRRNSVIMKVENCQIMPIEEAEEFVCKWENCYRQFESLEKLASHVTISHAIAGIDNLYYCKWEGCLRSHRGFNARYKMLVHCRTHTREKPHACQQCLKSFSRAENLKIHVRSHSGEKPYKCPFPGCGKAYSNSSDRFKHTRTHGNCKPYLCKVTGCNKRYTDPSSLRKHVKTFNHESLQMLQTNDITTQITNKMNDESVDKYYEHQITSQDALLKSQDQYYYHTSESYFNDNIIYNGTYSLDTSDAIYSNNCNKIYYDSSSWISRDDISQGMKSIKIDEPLDLRIHRDR